MVEEKNTKSVPISLYNPEDFLPATEQDKQGPIFVAESVSFWADGWRRFKKNKVAMLALFVIVFVILCTIFIPFFYPYNYREQISESRSLGLMGRSSLAKEKNERNFPHILGTDALGRDTLARLLMGSRISLLVGLCASFIVLVIGATYGAISGYFGGLIDLFMMQFVDLLYTLPDILVVVLFSAILREPLRWLVDSSPRFEWIGRIGIGLFCIFLIFALSYWVGMARMVRAQVLSLKEAEFVTAAFALGASSGRIIKKHLLTNCLGILIVSTTLQIPSAIFTESFLSFLGLGVSSPMPSLGSMAADALGSVYTSPRLLIAPTVLLGTITLAFNLLGDGLNSAFDPKLKS